VERERTIRAVFMGTPELAVTVLRSVLDLKTVDGRPLRVVGVFTQPDRPAGRGLMPAPPPVKLAAEEAGIPVFQPERLRHPEAMTELARLGPHIIVVAAYAQILSKKVLDMPRYGCLNVHASLLPRYRGASPIQAAILEGVAETGVTIMKMDEGLDSGPILSQVGVPVDPTDTTTSLSAKLAVAGGHLLAQTIKGWICNTVEAHPQNDAEATMTTRITKQDGLIDWSTPASYIERQVRALQPWPTAYTLLPAGPLKVLQAKALMAENRSLVPGTVFATADGPAVITGDGALLLQVVQPAGRRPMEGAAWLRGAQHVAGGVLRSSDAGTR
jgi:methionyl-tRNA formyltransferase